MPPLPANASTGFAWLRLQETGRRRAASGRQAGVLFQSKASHGLWPHHAAVSGFDGALVALRGRARGRVHAGPDGGQYRAASVWSGHRHDRSAPRISLAPSPGCAVEWLPQPVASTAFTGCRCARVRCGEPSCSIRAIGLDMHATVAAIRSVALRELSATDAALVSLMVRPCFLHFLSFSPMSLR